MVVLLYLSGQALSPSPLFSLQIYVKSGDNTNNRPINGIILLKILPPTAA